MTTEDLLTRTFAEVTERTDYPATTMADVVARSRAVQGDRRRRVALVAAAAVVVAGGISAGVALSGGGDDAPPAPAGPLGRLPSGPPPMIDYLEGSTFVTTSGQHVTSPVFGHAESATSYRNGVLVASRRTTRHPASMLSFVTSGPPARLGCGSTSFAVPVDGGDPVYWLFSGCTAGRSGRFVQGSTSTETAKGASFTPVGEVSDGVVAFVTSTGLRLHSHALVVPLDGGPTVPLHLMLPRAASETANLVCGDGGNGLDGVVVDAATGDVRWRARYWTLSGFSPSGQYVVGSQAVGQQTVSDIGDVVGIFDAATGRQILRKELPGLSIDTLPVFESDGSVLVTAEDHQGREALVRVGLDGSVTRTTHVVQGLPRPTEGRPPLPVLRPAATP